jgi:hypothetical protein
VSGRKMGIRRAEDGLAAVLHTVNTRCGSALGAVFKSQRRLPRQGYAAFGGDVTRLRRLVPNCAVDGGAYARTPKSAAKVTCNT